jgi:hypothetical protein
MAARSVVKHDRCPGEEALEKAHGPESEALARAKSGALAETSRPREHRRQPLGRPPGNTSGDKAWKFPRGSEESRIPLTGARSLRSGTTERGPGTSLAEEVNAVLSAALARMVGRGESTMTWLRWFDDLGLSDRKSFEWPQIGMPI